MISALEHVYMMRALLKETVSTCLYPTYLCLYPTYLSPSPSLAASLCLGMQYLVCNHPPVTSDLRNDLCLVVSVHRNTDLVSWFGQGKIHLVTFKKSKVNLFLLHCMDTLLSDGVKEFWMEYFGVFLREFQFTHLRSLSYGSLKGSSYRSRYRSL